MKKGLFLLIVILFSYNASAQYDQKISFIFSAGTFKTFGKKLGEYEPMQMPNYKMGFGANAGLQFRISERFSLSAELGIMISEKWSYKQGSNNDYNYWSINDSITGNLIAEGENYHDIFNYSLGIKPIYYITKGKKWSSYLYAGVNVNITRANYEDTQWLKLKELKMLSPGDTGPYNGYLEKNTGIGFNPGFGVEYFPKEKIGFYLNAGYYFIKLNKDNFKSPSMVENFNALAIQAGLRLYFIKSKDL
jgi:opacity protein-like surface antigen